MNTKIKKKFELIDNNFVVKANDVRMKYFNIPMELQELIDILKSQCDFYKVTVPQNLYLKYGMIVKGNDHKYRFSEGNWTFNTLQSTLRDIYTYIDKCKTERKKDKLTEDKCINFLKSITNEDGSPVYEIRKYVPARYETL